MQVAAGTAPALRLAELLGALSLATDLMNAQPAEHALRVALLAARLAHDEPLPLRQHLYWACLLRYLGCVGFAVEEAGFAAGDDIGLRESFERTDMGRPGELIGAVVRDLGRGAPLGQRVAGVARFFTSPQAPRQHAHAQCEAALHCARKLQMAAPVLDALDAVEERWDGRGQPKGRRGDELPLVQRYLEVARVAAGFIARSGLDSAVAAVRARGGGQLDPQLARRFVDDAAALGADLAAGSVWDGFLAAEPGLWLLDAQSLTPLFDAFALLADLKSGYFAGHSQGVARLAEAAARLAGLTDAEAQTLGRASLLHDLGRVAVPTGVWDKQGPLNAAEWDRVHLHSYTTDRVLRRSPTLRPYADIAGRCHERLDGSGYHRGDTVLDRSARLLGAADVYHACTEDRPWRKSLGSGGARRVVLDEAAAGKLCAQAVDAVLAAAGDKPTARASDALSSRELEVLRLLVRGWSNKEIARELAISPRTVQHHTIHIYAKTGVQSRAGVALWAVERRLF